MTNQSEDKRKVSKKTAAVFDRFYKLLACAALILAVAPLLHTLLIPVAGKYAFILTVVIAPAMFTAGYAMQALFGTVTRVARTPYSRGYEKIERYFIPSKAVLPLVLCAVAGFVVMSVLSNVYASGVFGLHDKASAVPVFAGILTGVITAAGVVTWFYPYGYIVSLRTLFVYFVLIIGDFLLNLAFLQSQNFLAFCTVAFVICALVVINQNHIISVISSAGTGIVTPRVRYYNLITVGLICLLVALMLPIVFIILVGTTVLRNILLYFILRENMEEFNDDIMEASETAAIFNNRVFMVQDLNQALSKVLFIIFFVFLLGTIIFFIVIRHRSIFNAIINFLNALFTNIMEFFANLFAFNRISTEKFVISDYRDIETKTHKAAIREFAGIADQRPPRSYRDFIRRLELLSNPRERLIFAYNVLIGCWAENYHIYIKLSDTPAEIEEKVKEVSSDAKAEPITRAFEYVKYAERSLPDTESARLISAMCAQIRLVYDS